MGKEKEKGETVQPCFNLCGCLKTSNLSDDERRRILILLTECVAAILKVDAKISSY